MKKRILSFALAFILVFALVSVVEVVAEEPMLSIEDWGRWDDELLGHFPSAEGPVFDAMGIFYANAGPVGLRSYDSYRSVPVYIFELGTVITVRIDGVQPHEIDLSGGGVIHGGAYVVEDGILVPLPVFTLVLAESRAEVGWNDFEWVEQAPPWSGWERVHEPLWERGWISNSIYYSYVLSSPGIEHWIFPVKGAAVIEAVASTDTDSTATEQTTALNIADASEWARDYINRAYTLGLLPTALQNFFFQATTRAEFAALAVYLYENQRGTITGRSEFADTNDVNVHKAAYIGVVQGVGNNRFAPNDALTREQAAVMLARLANAMGQPLPPSAPTFADNAQVSSWAVDAVGQMQASGIMGGVGDNRFAPSGDYTREQSIVTIMRLFEILE